MGGIPVVEVTRGGIPVTESDRGVPYEIAANGMGVPVRFVASGGAPFKGGGYLPEAAALFARMSPAPSPAEKAVINQTYASLKMASVWPRLTGLYLNHAPYQQWTALNWVSATYDAAVEGAPVFTAYSDLRGDGVSAAMNSGYVPAPGSQNNLHMGVYSGESTQFAPSDMGNAQSVLVCRSTTDTSIHRIFRTASGNVANTNGAGHFVTTRSGTLSADNDLYRNGSLLLGNAGGADNPPVGDPLKLFKGAGQYSARRIRAWHYGISISPTQMEELRGVLEAYFATMVPALALLMSGDATLALGAAPLITGGLA